MNMFKSEGFSKFFVSINNKNNVLKSYLSEMGKMYDLDLIKETKPLGSAGALKKIGKLHLPFFVVNCDSLLDIKPKQLLNFHNENKNDLTMVAALKEFNIPYGVCEINKKNGRLINMNEKPKKNVVANSGMYIIEPQVLLNLPKKNSFGMNELIKILIKKKKKIGVFPIKDSDWKDTGNWFDYMKAIQQTQ